MTFKLQKLSNDLGYKKSTIKSSTSFNQILVQSFDKKFEIHLFPPKIIHLPTIKNVQSIQKYVTFWEILDFKKTTSLGQRGQIVWFNSYSGVVVRP